MSPNAARSPAWARRTNSASSAGVELFTSSFSQLMHLAPVKTPPKLGRFLGEAEDAFADDVALDLAGTTPDGLAAAEEERAHHRAHRIAGAAFVACGRRP